MSCGKRGDLGDHRTGFVQRHVVHAATTIQQPPGHAIALHFACLVGTVSLAVGHGGGGVLIVPDVRAFASSSGGPFLNPGRRKTATSRVRPDGPCKQVGLRAAEAGLGARVEHCLAIRFSSTMWNPNQKGRVSVLDVAPRASDLDFFETVDGLQCPQAKGDGGQAGEKGRATAKVLGWGRCPGSRLRKTSPTNGLGFRISGSSSSVPMARTTRQNIPSTQL